MPPAAGAADEKAGQPQVETPPREQRARVHRGHGRGHAGATVAEHVAKTGACAGRRSTSQPELGLSHVAPNPEGQEGRQHADEEHRPPAPPRAARSSSRARPGRSRSPTRSASARAPCRGARRATSLTRARRRSPTRHPCRCRAGCETRRAAGGCRQAARRGEHRVDDDARHQRARAAVAIGDDAKDEAAGGGREERAGANRAGRRLRDVQSRP